MGSLAVERLETLLRAKQLDRTLVSRAPDAGQPPPAMAPTGIEALDRALTGGWRRGEVSELVGSRSSGRTTTLMATLAAATRRDEVVGLVDAVDRFDPVTAAAAGVVLDRVLWVRGPTLTLELGRAPLAPRAVQQAIRACDLIVRAGGFSIVALDLADVPVRLVRALPFTTWMRLAHANEGRDTVCLLVGDGPMGKSARGATVRIEASSCWTGSHARSRRLSGIELQFDVLLSRL